MGVLQPEGARDHLDRRPHRGVPSLWLGLSCREFTIEQEIDGNLENLVGQWRLEVEEHTQDAVERRGARVSVLRSLRTSL